MDEMVQLRYNDAIQYYWRASRNNKRAYKLTRSLTVILGAVVTLVASLTSSELIAGHHLLKIIFGIGTPVVAACLTIIAGFSQAFQWGSTWQNMVLTAQKLQKEYDRYLTTKPEDRDYAKEVEVLNQYIIHESQSFFDRMLGCGQSSKDSGGTSPADKMN